MLGVIPLYAATARLRNRSVNGASQAARARAGDFATLAADLLARIPAVHVSDRADTETQQLPARQRTRRSHLHHRAGRQLPSHPTAGLGIALTDVTYSHHPGQPLLSGLNLRVSPGKLVCVSGPSGAGKSTLLSLLIRLADSPAHNYHDTTAAQRGTGWMRATLTAAAWSPASGSASTSSGVHGLVRSTSAALLYRYSGARATPPLPQP